LTELPAPQRFQSTTIPEIKNDGAGVKLHFYVDSDDDAERCRESLQFGTPIIIDGTDTLTGRVKSYSGIVLSIESAEAPGEHFRITIATDNTGQSELLNERSMPRAE
jgi:hypothetical protein